VSAFESYHSYMRGWQAGAGSRPMDPKFAEHPTRPDLKWEYESGYKDGQDARARVGVATATRLQYVPSILRTQDEEESGS